MSSVTCIECVYDPAESPLLIEEDNDMNQMFEALRELHVGCDVVDIRLLANAEEINGRPGPDMDGEFADAIRSSAEFSLVDQFCGRAGQ